MYKVEWTEKALKKLAKISKPIKVDQELALNPYLEGWPLKGDLKGLWSFHYASYRVIYQIEQNKLLVMVVEVAHRQKVYKKN